MISPQYFLILSVFLFKLLLCSFISLLTLERNHLSLFHKDWFLEIYLIRLFGTYSLVYSFSLTVIGFVYQIKQSHLLILTNQSSVRGELCQSS